MPFFSVVIPTYNRAALLREALDSVFAQEFTDFEVIVVDDGSTDETASVVGAYGGRIRYLRQENRGPGAARNLGIAHATGRYIVFLDSDDLWFAWTLAVLRRVIADHREPALVAGTHVNFAEGATPPAVAEDTPRARVYPDYIATARDGVWMGTCAVAIHRDGLPGSPRFNEGDMNGEDHDLWLRFGTAPGFVRIEGPPLFAYRRHAASRVGDLARTIAGARHLVRQEEAGAYPGGRARRRERLAILGRHLRPVVVACARAGRPGEAWTLYRDTFAWNLAFGRARFLLAAPALMLLGSGLRPSSKRELPR